MRFFLPRRFGTGTEGQGTRCQLPTRGNVSVGGARRVFNPVSSFRRVARSRGYIAGIPFLLATLEWGGASNNASLTITRKTFAEFPRSRAHSQGALRISHRRITYFAIRPRSFGKPPLPPPPARRVLRPAKCIRTAILNRGCKTYLRVFRAVRRGDVIKSARNSRAFRPAFPAASRGNALTRDLVRGGKRQEEGENREGRECSGNRV